MSRLTLSPGDLDFLDGNMPLASPCSIPPTPSPYGSQRMSWRKLPPSLNDETFASAALHLDVPATPSPNGGSYPMGLTAPSMLLRPSLTAGELNYRSLQRELDMVSLASIPPPPAALAPQVGLQYPSQVPRVPPPPAHAPQLSWELEDLDNSPPAPEYLPQEHNAGPGSQLAQQLLQQFAAEERAMHTVKVKNTFIDSGLARSPSLEHLRETKSCPGSRLPTPLPTPTCESKGKGFGIKKELETMSGISGAAVSSLVEKVSRQRYHMSSPKPSLQAAAWQGQHNQTFPQYGQEEHATKPAPQVVQLERLLAFNGLDALPEPPFVQKAFLPERQSSFDTTVSKSAMPRLGSPDLPSVGSLGHHIHRCKPCAFVQRMGCSNGVQCNFCHLCEPGEKKRRRKEKRALIGAARKLQVAE